jgi:hypothetical protein
LRERRDHLMHVINSNNLVCRMIPFLPEDAVVEKKDGSVELLLSGKQHESSTQFGGSGVPVVGAIPPKRFSPPSSFVGES